MRTILHKISNNNVIYRRDTAAAKLSLIPRISIRQHTTVMVEGCLAFYDTLLTSAGTLQTDTRVDFIGRRGSLVNKSLNATPKLSQHCACEATWGRCLTLLSSSNVLLINGNGGCRIQTCSCLHFSSFTQLSTEIIFMSPFHRN